MAYTYITEWGLCGSRLTYLVQQDTNKSVFAHKKRINLCVCLFLSFVCLSARLFVIQACSRPFYASFVVERCVLQSKPRCAPPSAL